MFSEADFDPGSCWTEYELVSPIRCQENSTHLRQSRPASGPGFQVKVPKNFQGVPASLGSGLDGKVQLTEGRV